MREDKGRTLGSLCILQKMENDAAKLIIDGKTKEALDVLDNVLAGYKLFILNMDVSKIYIKSDTDVDFHTSELMRKVIYECCGIKITDDEKVNPVVTDDIIKKMYMEDNKNEI